MLIERVVGRTTAKPRSTAMRRRTFFGVVGTSAAVAALPGFALAARTGAASSASAEGAPSAASIDFLLMPLVGRSLAGGFRVESVSPIDRGAVTITLVRDGARALVQVFRRSAASNGLATTRLFDLRWMNGANGEHATPEAGGVAVMTLASRIRRLEAAMLRGGLSGAQRTALP